LKHLAEKGMGENTLRALTSDLGYLEAWAQAAKAFSLFELRAGTRSLRPAGRYPNQRKPPRRVPRATSWRRGCNARTARSRIPCR
jgi:hypothetical protein